ncbi:hypothetical protein L1049_012334 [Liquidambar formosana]|uniref:Uncharacterized protein n=1 Tax=Liquidambar formosana TaxID=63359 RepID=A0AAP0RYY4_LIQFO
MNQESRVKLTEISNSWVAGLDFISDPKNWSESRPVMMAPPRYPTSTPLNSQQSGSAESASAVADQTQTPPFYMPSYTPSKEQPKLLSSPVKI